MNVVELPFPANVTIDKLMATEGLDRSGESEDRNSEGPDAAVLHKGSGCGPCSVEYTSLSRNKKAAEASCMNKNLPSCFKFGDGGKRHHAGEASKQIPPFPKQEEKPFGRKYVKKQVGNPSKRLRTDEADSSVKSAGTDDPDGISDKSQMVKQKRVYDSKRADRKNFRASMKNRYDSLTSKSGLVYNATFSSGNTILGTHGFKSDLHDISKTLDNLSISELLDGSHEVPKLSLDTGQKSSNVNDNILLSVRKACSILSPPSHSTADDGSNTKASKSCQDPIFTTECGSGCETKDKQLEDSLTKTKDSLQTNWIESTLLSPKEIIEHLAHPLSHDCGAVFMNQNMTLASELLTSEAKSCSKSSLPPFPWSFSNGNSKHSVELCKVNSTKHSCQGKWVKIGSSSISTVVDGFFLSGLSKEYGCNADSMNQQIIDVLEDVKTFVSTVSNKSYSMGINPIIQFTDMVKSDTVSDVPSSFNSKAFELIRENADSSISHHLECVCKGQVSPKNLASVIGSRCLGDDVSLGPSKSNISFKDKAVVKECPTECMHDCSVSSCSYTSRNAAAGSDYMSWKLPTCEKFGQVHSSEQVLAADILCEIACCSDPKQAAKNSSERIRWPKAPSMKTMKARKLSHSINKPDRSLTTAECSHSIKKAGLPFEKHHLGSERIQDFVRTRISDREAVRWSSVPIEAASPLSKLAEDLNQRLPPFPSQADKVYHNQQRKAPPKSAVASEGSSIRDWIRGRSRRIVEMEGIIPTNVGIGKLIMSSKQI